MLSGWLRYRGRAWSCVAIDAAVVAYAAWTVVCHAVVLLRGNTYTLAYVTAACLGVAFLAALALAYRGFRSGALAAWLAGPAEVPASATGTAPASVGGTAPPIRDRIVLAALAGVVMALWLVLHNELALWISLLVFTLVALWLCARDQVPVVPDDGRNPRWQELLLWAAAAVFAFLAVYIHRWRNDDCYYVNLAVTIVDLPHEPLLSVQSIHLPFPNVPNSNGVFAPYRVHTFEALGGLISFVTGLEAIRAMHIVLSCVSAFFMPLAYARLFRLLDPQRWFWMVVAVVLFLSIDGSGDRGFANQAFVRAFTGKAVMLNAALPMLIYYGITLAQRPSRLALGRFAAAQIAAIGLSSTGLWLAPIAGMLAVAVPQPLRWKSLRVIGLGLLGSSYSVAIALWVRAQMMQAAERGTADNAVAVVGSKFTMQFPNLRSAFEQNIGAPRVTQVYIGLMLLAFPLCRTTLARRYLAVFCIMLTALLLNPWLIDFFRYNVLGRTTGPRAFWLAPLPAALAICFVAAIPDMAAGTYRRAIGVGVMLVGLSVMLTVVPRRYVLSRANYAIRHWPPGPKVPDSAFAVVRRLKQILPPNSVVLAPELVSWYLPTIHHHPYPLLANAKYMRADNKEEDSRTVLVKIVRGKNMTRTQRERFAKGLKRYDLAAVVLAQKAAAQDYFATALSAADYRRVKIKKTTAYEVWVKRSRIQISACGEKMSVEPGRRRKLFR